VETLGRRYLYGIKIQTPGNTFNLCPADICQRSDGVELVRTACPIDAADNQCAACTMLSCTHDLRGGV